MLSYLFLLLTLTLTNPRDNAEMVIIPAGIVELGLPDSQIERSLDIFRFSLGSEPKTAWLSREKGVKQERTKRFGIYVYEVTNKMFETFVRETSYKTKAEKEGYGYVLGATSMRRLYGANWMKPNGPSSSILDKMNHPVVQVCLDDVEMYAKWAKARLPNEAEWIRAASGGTFKLYPWGSFWNDGKANAGRYPVTPYIDTSDGFATTSPVGNYKNGVSIFGCYDMSGNVWEWTNSTENREEQYIIKGGAWFSNAFCLRIPCKAFVDKDFRCDGLGFRLVVDLE